MSIGDVESFVLLAIGVNQAMPGVDFGLDLSFLHQAICYDGS